MVHTIPVRMHKCGKGGHWTPSKPSKLLFASIAPGEAVSKFGQFLYGFSFNCSVLLGKGKKMPDPPLWALKHREVILKSYGLKVFMIDA